MHFWQSALINTAKCRSGRACSDSDPPPGENAALHGLAGNDHGAVVSRSSDRGKALAARLDDLHEGLFLRETDAGGCYQRRVGGGGGEPPSSWCRTADLLGIKYVPPLRFHCHMLRGR